MKLEEVNMKNKNKSNYVKGHLNNSGGFSIFSKFELI